VFYTRRRVPPFRPFAFFLRIPPPPCDTKSPRCRWCTRSLLNPFFLASLFLLFVLEVFLTFFESYLSCVLFFYIFTPPIPLPG